MLSALGHAAAAAGAVVTLASMTYMAGAIWALRVWSRREVPAATVLPAVTVLKPLCGDEPELYENLRSFCDQDYPEYQIVFGVRDTADPSVAVARRLQEEFTPHTVAVVVDARVIGDNLKVSNLANMLPAARHDCLFIADSDIRVGRDYLRRVVGPLNDPGVGVVTCPYRGRPVGSLWSRLGAMFINEWFLPSVLVARALGSSAFSFGSTLALRRASLDAVGGFAALADHLADDYLLGKLTRRRGLRTVLSPYLVETVVHEPGAAALLRHELRWARTIRTVQPWGYAGSWLTYTFPVSLAGAVLIHSLPWSVALPLLALTLRVVLHYTARNGLQLADPPFVWLVPLRDILCFIIWSGGFLNRRVTWRRQELAVRNDGRIEVDKELLP
jgi:ceramide glucosyltransferase